MCSDRKHEHKERHKITYKVNVKTQVDLIWLWTTQILQYMWCESRDVASIVFIASSLENENIGCYVVTANQRWGSPKSLTSRWRMESDMMLKTTVAVFKYHWAPTTRLYTPWNDVMNTDTLSFPTFLGLQNWKSAEMMSKSDVVNRKWQVSLLLMLLANAYCVGRGAVRHNLTNISGTSTVVTLQKWWLYRP